jgi:hypothetical protein
MSPRQADPFINQDFRALGAPLIRLGFFVA